MDANETDGALVKVPVGAGDVAERPQGEVTDPIVIDLGKAKRRDLKALEQGRGVVWDEIAQVIGEVRDELGAELGGKVLVPVVLVYRKRAKRRRNGLVSPFAR